MAAKFRLIPAVIAAAVLLLGIRLADLWVAFDARAATGKEEAQIAPAAGTPPAPGETVAEATPAGAPVAAARPDDKGGTDLLARDPLLMSPAEIDLLLKLSERRSELDRRAAELAQREVLLKAAEQRIDGKIAELKSLEQDIGGLVDKRDEEETQRLKSLVKIYEVMKPREAARIFEQLDMPVLLDVLEHMKELKASPILASLDPAKARQVTLALAERRQQHAQRDAQVRPTQAAVKP